MSQIFPILLDQGPNVKYTEKSLDLNPPLAFASALGTTNADDYRQGNMWTLPVICYHWLHS